MQYLGRYPFYALILPAAWLLGACSPQGVEQQDAAIRFTAVSPTIETVNGVKVPQAMLEAVARARGLDLGKPEEQTQALGELTDLVLLSQEARRLRLDAKADFQAQVEIARLQGVASATVAQLQKSTPITPDMVKAEYDRQVERAGSVEYDFSQLLFDNEDEALKAAGEVLAGTAFEKVYDEWKDKAKQARAFEKVRLGQIPEESLAHALEALKPGATTTVPVKTAFGWHVLHLQHTAPFTPPPFEQVKGGIQQMLQQRTTEERLKALREQATVTAAQPPQ